MGGDPLDNLAKAHDQKEENVDYEVVASSSAFKSLLSAKKAFLVPMIIFFMLFYFMLPILTSFTNVLNQPAIGSITWTWMYAFAQFVMTWVLCMIYVKKAAKFDKDAEQIIESHKTQGER
ncbi:hypothetical protein CKF48_00045 [Cytobacillus kochii]|uniref:DUF485 domain-containing protein n=1 Tax=Cytobacillus kochii TaxID=859143 RepID=A0A248TCA0_9BACI|nr:hypothetical protein CKF48_00045 [Cytobacillus kochii]